MPSSISSSSHRAPSGPWALTWSVTGLLMLLFVLAWEIFWRLQGFTPALEDSPALWAFNRARIRSGDPEQVVMTGASRMQLGIDLDVFDRNFPGPKPVQLAIDASSPNHVLYHLAENESFEGVLICSVWHWFYRPGSESQWDRSAEYIQFYRNVTPADFSELFIAGLFRESLTLPYTGLNPLNIYRKIREGKRPRPPYQVIRWDRYRPADYSLAEDLDSIRRKRLRSMERILSSEEISREELIANLDKIERAVEKIQGRGGRVVFVYLPISGPVRDLEEKIYPRSRYWDLWASRSKATFVNFEDYPSLSGFDCPDYSHLDYRQAAEFSESLAIIIREKLFDK